MRKKVAAGLIVLAALLGSPGVAHAQGGYQCRQPAYAKQHQDECGSPNNNPFLLGGGGTSGGQGGGGLLGSIGRALGL